MKTFLLLSLHIFLAQPTVVHSNEFYVRVGEMIALNCPNIRMSTTETPPSWTSFTPHKRDLTNDINSTSQFMIHKRSLILLNASKDHQGNYSCSIRNQTFWYKLVVYSVLSDDNQRRAQYTTPCFSQQRCTLYCPRSNMPKSIIPNMTELGIRWDKDGRSEFIDTLSFSSVEETDQGTFSCTRSYLYEGQMYNMTFSIALVVKAQEPLSKVEIVSPHDGNVFEVELGSVFVVNCTATISKFDQVYWIIDKSFVGTDSNSRVFSNNTIVRYTKKSHMTTLLIFKEVVKEDLSKNFTCKLESAAVKPNMVTISLVLKKPKNFLFLIVLTVTIVLVTAITALICFKFKMDIFLFLRDHLHFCTKSRDAKLYDATLLCYKSDSEMALREVDLKWLENVLEKELGYKLCHRNDFSGEEKPVLDSTEQSHAVILVPIVSNPGPDRSLITEDCSSLDTSTTRVILIQTEPVKKSKLNLKVQEAVPLLSHLEQRIITWKGTASPKKSSSFIKHLRYHMPPQNSAERMVV